MKIFLFLLSAVAINSFSSNISYEGVSQEIKIGIVNPIEVYHRVPEGEQRIQNLQEKLKSQIEELQQEQNNLFRDKRNLENDASVMTADNYKKKEEEYKNREEQFQQKIAIFRQKEMQQEQMIAQDFQDKFNSAVSDVARNNSYTLILSSQAVAYAAPIVRDDITEQVILKMKSS